MCYGPDGDDAFATSALLVAKILSGAKPSDLPVERSTKFQLWVNLKTAKGLHLTVPDTVLVKATKMIK